MVKAIKVMLIPNNVQKTKMFQYAGASRFAYNWALAREIENYEILNNHAYSSECLSFVNSFLSSASERNFPPFS